MSEKKRKKEKHPKPMADQQVGSILGKIMLPYKIQVFTLELIYLNIINYKETRQQNEKV